MFKLVMKTLFQLEEVEANNSKYLNIDLVYGKHNDLIDLLLHNIFSPPQIFVITKFILNRSIYGFYDITEDEIKSLYKNVINAKEIQIR